jgi:hypothetical protein
VQSGEEWYHSDVATGRGKGDGKWDKCGWTRTAAWWRQQGDMFQ